MLGFGALCGPVIGRKGDAPEARGRLQKLNGYFGISGVRSFNLNHPAHLFVTRFDVPDCEQLADMKRFGGDDQSAVYIDDDSIDFLGK